MDVKRASLTILSLILLIYFGLYFNTPPFLVKSQIQAFIDEVSDANFTVVEIDRTYSVDMFHQVVGYKVDLEDSDGVKVNNIFIEKRKGKWRLFKGSDIDSQHEAARSASPPTH